METILFLVIVALVWIFSRVLVDWFFKKKRNAWKKRDPLLGVVMPVTKSQKKEEEK